MCIRDRGYAVGLAREFEEAEDGRTGGIDFGDQVGAAKGHVAVSYTHLTLPTSDLV